jgi:FlaA1/EpsC-like NDP-sugar epimerase
MLNFLLNNLNRKTKQVIVVFNDFLIFIITMWLSFSVRYDELYVFRENDLIIIFCCLVIFYSSTFFFGIYNQIFRYASYSAALQVTYAVIVYGFLSFILLSTIQELFGWNGPRSVSIIHSTLIIILIVLSRYIISEILKKNNKKLDNKKNLAIYGISQTAIQIARSAQLDENYLVVCFVDEDKNNIGKKIFNIPVISINTLK